MRTTNWTAGPSLRPGARADRLSWSRSGVGSVLALALPFFVACTASDAAASGDRAPEVDAERQEVSPLEGAWDATEYRLATGATHEVRGQIFFTGSDWTVLFFVVDALGEPRRGSAEGGTYTLNGTELVFTHLYNLSVGSEMEGLATQDLQMTARTGDGPTEPTSITLVGDRLTLHFPSGNEMSFRRSS